MGRTPVKHTKREYLPEPVQVGGVWKRQHIFRCATCGGESSIAVSGAGAPMPPSFVEKKMQEREWVLGKTAGADICPACAKKVFQEKKAKKEPASMADVTTKRAEAPRSPSFDEKRLIFAKLNDVYLDDRRGYSGTWSDKRVAEDLGIPWKWVEDIREANFGPQGSNEMVNEVVAEAKELLSQVEATRKAREEQDKAFAGREEALRKRLAEVFKAIA